MPIATKNKQLYVKSYFAASIPEAMDQARQELGPDALLLNTREAPPEARHLGAYEVVFGGSPEPAAAAGPAAPQASSGGVDDLRVRIDEIRSLLTRFTPGAAYSRARNGVVAEALVDAGVEPGLATQIDDAVRQRASKRAVLEIARPRAAAECSPETLTAETTAEMASRFEVLPEIGRITALVGPPGCGKTTTLIKLAIQEGLAKGRAVRLYSADTQRIGAVEQLLTYANILGVPFQAVDSPAALAQAIDAAPANALLLIDTPGLSAAMLEELGGDLARFLAARQDIDTHLVLTASMRPADLEKTVNCFEIFQPSRLLFTKLDETSSYAAIFCEAARRGKPLSFFCQGQNIPEDLEPASKERITDSLVRQLPQAFQAVA